jgi:hypothetical protein
MDLVLYYTQQLQKVFVLVIGFDEHKKNETSNNYASLAEIHTSKISVTKAHINSSPCKLAVARNRLPTVDSLSFQNIKTNNLELPIIVRVPSTT